MKTKAASTIMGLLFYQAAIADPQDWVRFSGFGTVGVTKSYDKTADYITSFEQSQGTGKTFDRDSQLDSRYGVQLDATLGQGLTSTVQLLAKERGDKSFKPDFEWANIKYDVNDDLFVRVGRTVVPTFLFAASRAVGYSQTMLRLPVEVYASNPFSYVNGVDAGYTYDAGPILYKFGTQVGEQKRQFSYGAIQFRTETKLKMVYGSAEFGPSKLRAAYLDTSLKFSSDVLTAYDDSLAALIAANVSNSQLIRDAVDWSKVKLRYTTLGYTYENRDFRFQTEYIRSEPSKIPQNQVIAAYYAMASMRFGIWTPYLSISGSQHKNSSLPQLNSTALPSAAGLVNAINSSFGLTQESTSISTGVRLDLLPNVAWKAQVDHIKKPAGVSSSVFTNTSPEFINSRRAVNVISTTLDYVF